MHIILLKNKWEQKEAEVKMGETAEQCIRNGWVGKSTER